MAELTYVLPLKADAPQHQLDGYLAMLCQRVPVVVVDGSAPGVFERHHEAWAPLGVDHRPVDDDLATPMGKVGGVLTGMRHAPSDKVVLGDDDVRWSPAQLERAARLLDEAEVVRPQNRFLDRPWHARWDTGRTLLARALGGDWPGTLAVRRSALPEGYRGDVLFENLELVRSVRASGGRELVALDLVVDRVAPPAATFREQRVRQAYDELARPLVMAAELAVLPAAVLGGRRARRAIVGASIALAGLGRRRAGGRRWFAASDVLWAPAWLAERAVTSWLALAERFRGGVPYRDGRLTTAASSMRALRRLSSSEERPAAQDPSRWPANRASTASRAAAPTSTSAASSGWSSTNPPASSFAAITSCSASARTWTS